MLCVNKLTNLVFNAKKKNAKHNLLPFSFFYLFIFLIYIFEKNKKEPRMKCMNVMQCKSQKKRKQKPKNNGHKEQSNEAQGPRKPKMTRDTESHQLLDKVSQTYFYQEVW